MSKLIPDYVFDSIYDITPEVLTAHGVRGVLVDLDGTMASHKAALPPDTLHTFVDRLKNAGIAVLQDRTPAAGSRIARARTICVNGYSFHWFSPEYRSFSRVSAHKIEFAQQIHKKREHVSRFLYIKREKVSKWELSDDFGTAHGPFLLSAEL